MSVFETQQSSYLNSELQVSSKIDNKSDDENEEIAQLSDKITQMERNYIQMEKYYAAKLRSLHQQLMQKDHQYKKLQSEILDMKQLGNSHRKKVEELTHAHSKNQPPSKSRSPLFRKSTDKGSNNMVKVSTNSSGTLSHRKQADKKSQSPKNESKKYSPPPSHRSPYQKTMFQKPQFLKDHSPILNKNSSSQRFSKKSISPKNSYEQKKTGSMRNLDGEYMNMGKKVSKGIGSLKEKAPTFK